MCKHKLDTLWEDLVWGELCTVRPGRVSNPCQPRVATSPLCVWFFLSHSVNILYQQCVQAFPCPSCWLQMRGRHLVTSLNKSCPVGGGGCREGKRCYRKTQRSGGGSWSRSSGKACQREWAFHSGLQAQWASPGRETGEEYPARESSVEPDRLEQLKKFWCSDWHIRS